VSGGSNGPTLLRGRTLIRIPIHEGQQPGGGDGGFRRQKLGGCQCKYAQWQGH